MKSKVIVPVCSYASHIDEATDSTLLRLWCKDHYICARCIFLYTITDSHSPILTCCKCKNQIPEPTDRSKPLYTISRVGNDCALVTANAIIHRFRDSRVFITHHPEMSRIVQSFRTFEDGMEYDMMEILQALADRNFHHTNCMIWHLDNTSNEVVIPDDALAILVKSPQHFYAYIKKGPNQWRLFDSTFVHLKRFVSFQELKILLEPFMDSKYNTAAVAIVNRQPCAVNNSSCDPIASKARICGKHLVCGRCDEDDSKRAYCNEDMRFYCNICTHKDISYDGITDEDQILALLCATSEDNYDDVIPCGFDSISGSRDTAEDKTMIGMRSISVEVLDTFASSKLEGINELSDIPSTDTADASNPCNRSIDTAAAAVVRNSPKPTPMMKFMKRPKITISARKTVVNDDKDITTTIKSLPWPLTIKIDSDTSSLLSSSSSSSSVVVRGKYSPNNYQSLLSSSVSARTRSSTTEEMKPPPVFIRRPKLAPSVSITSTGSVTTDSSGTDERSSPFINTDRLDVNDDNNDNRISILLPQSIDSISPEHSITTSNSSSRSISSTSNRRKFEKRQVLETRMSSPLLRSSLSSDLQSQTADDMTSNDMSSRSSASLSLGNEEIASQSSQDSFRRSMSSTSLRPQSVGTHINQKVLGLRIPSRPPSYHPRTTSIDSLENSVSLLTDSSSSPLNDDEYEREKTRFVWDHSFVPSCCHTKHISPSKDGVSYILLWCGRHYLCSRCTMIHDAPDSHSVLLHCYQCQIHNPDAIDRLKPMFTVPRFINDCCLVTANAIINQCREMGSRKYITPEYMYEVIRKHNQSDYNDIIVEYTMPEVLAAMLCRDFDSVSLCHSRSNDDDEGGGGDTLLKDIPESVVSILIQSSKHFYAYLKVESDKWRLFDPSFQLKHAYLLSKELPLVLRPVLKGSPDNQIIAITNRDLSLGN